MGWGEEKLKGLTFARLNQKEALMATKLTWYGHAALGLETGGYKIIVDPFLTGNPAASLSADDVDADFILISTDMVTMWVTV
jgi:Beta-lactamase superfamily domain